MASVAEIQNSFQHILGHPVAQSDLAHWAQLPNQDAIEEELIKSDEYKNVTLPKIIKNAYKTILNRDEDPTGYQQWLTKAQELASQGVRGASWPEDITRVVDSGFKESEEYADLVAEAAYTEIMGRESDPGGKEFWKQQYLEQVRNGVDPVDAKKNIAAGFRESTEYVEAGGYGGEWTRKLFGNIQNGIDELPPFVWGDEEKANALAIAEATYGPYFAGLVEEQVENASIATNRTNEDVTRRIAEINQDLSDYLAGTETQRTRAEQDYQISLAETARQLGLTVDQVMLNRGRATEDTTRRLAELSFDYERLSGRLSDDKIRELGRLLSESAKQTGRLDEDEQRILTEINEDRSREMAELLSDFNKNGGRLDEDKNRRLTYLLDDYQTETGRITEDKNKLFNELDADYNETKRRILEDKTLNEDAVKREFAKRLEANTEEMAFKGTLYSGRRIKTERELSEEETRQLQTIARETGRNIYDVERDYTRAKDRAETSTGRTLADMAKSFNKETEATTTTYTRTVQDMADTIARQQADILRTSGRAEEQTQTEAERKRQDIAETTGMNVADIEREAQRKLEDAQAILNRQQETTTTSYERNLEDLNRIETQAEEEARLERERLALQEGRTTEDITKLQEQKTTEAGTQTQNLTIAQQRALEDIQRDLAAKQKELTYQKESEIKTGAFGTIEQEQEAQRKYDEEFAQQERDRLAPNPLPDDEPKFYTGI